MLVAIAVQMIGGRPEPAFPRFITARRLPTRYLLRIGSRAVPVLQYLERVVSNVVPAVLVALIALSYIEEDGLLLCLASFAAVILIGIELVAVWGAVSSAAFISSI